jgi:hypothetical protein
MWVNRRRMKARKPYRFFRISGWIVGGFISLILLATLAFYLGRGWIMERAVRYVNMNQPGEVQMGQMNLIPFRGFPDVALNLRQVSYYERKIHPDSLLFEPILSLKEVAVTLDVFDLIRGDIRVDRARLSDGFIRIEIYEDSTMNVGNALGLDPGVKTKNDTAKGLPAIQVDLEKLEISNLLAILEDHRGGDHFSIQINSAHSRFSYLPDHVEAGINLQLDINSFKYLTYKLETRKSISLTSDLSISPLDELITLSPSKLDFAGLELETQGTFDYSEAGEVDLSFEASNRGLELLNFIFRGILDLDEIEQIGSGTIHLGGTLRGKMGETLPEIQIRGRADDIGFRIRSIRKEVTGISFHMLATSGTSLDLSEASLEIEGFKARFPEGSVSASIRASNLVSPEFDVWLDGQVDLDGMEQMIRSDALQDLRGSVILDGRVHGKVDRDSGELLSDAGTLRAMLSDGGFVLDRDTLENINGELFIRKNMIGTENLQLEMNGNHLFVDLKTENLLHYLMGFDRGLSASLTLASEVLYPSTLVGDTAVAGLLGDELKGLHFKAGLEISKEELDAFLREDSVPRVHLSLDSFGLELPVYSDISDLNASVTFGPDTLDLEHLSGSIGESAFRFSGMISNLGAISKKDSGEVVNILYNLQSDLMRAEDFFTYRDGFILPETYQTEYLEDFRISGSLELPVYGLVTDSVDLDFGLSIRDLGWNFRYYPLKFKDFLVEIDKEEDRLKINKFRGRIGESNLQMTAVLENINDTARENLRGELVLESDLLDFNELLNYQLPEELKDTAAIDSSEIREPPRLDRINYPGFDFQVDIEELRYGENRIYGMNGKLRSTPQKIFYLDHLVTSGESGGRIDFNGQFNVSNPYLYTFSAELDLQDINIDDLSFEMQSGEETYTLKENFDGVVSASGLAEIFITPDLKFDMSTTTAVFNVRVTDGALINFTPLQAAARYLDNKDLNHVKFATLRNSFTLMDSRIMIPLMNVESTIGQLLIEGEQGLDNSFLYLLRVPTWLVRGAARSMITGAEDDNEEDQIRQMEMGKFLRLTAWGNGEESEVKLGDKRERYLE